MALKTTNKNRTKSKEPLLDPSLLNDIYPLNDVDLLKEIEKEQKDTFPYLKFYTIAIILTILVVFII